MLPLVIGLGALGYAGLKLKKWHEKSEEENAYWTDDPKDIIYQMLRDMTDDALIKIDSFEEKTEKFFNQVDKILDIEKVDPRDPKVQTILEEIRKTESLDTKQSKSL